MENLHTRTETLTLSGSSSVPKAKAENDLPAIFIFAIVFLFFFIYFQSNGSGNSRQNDQENAKKYPLSTEEKKLSDRIRMLEHSLKSLSIKKREIENELHKIEMESLTNDQNDPFDAEIKTDKLRMKIEEIAFTEEKKYGELQYAKQAIDELYFTNNQV